MEFSCERGIHVGVWRQETHEGRRLSHGVKSLRSSYTGLISLGDSTPCRMTRVTLHGVVSPESPALLQAFDGGS